MDKKQLEEFEFDICSLHEYFFDQNKERMEEFEVTKQDLIDANREYYERQLKEVRQIIEKKQEPKYSFPVSVAVLVDGPYDPTEHYLNELIEFFEYLNKEENQVYLNKAFIYDCSDACGMGVHTTTQCMLIADFNCLFEFGVAGRPSKLIDNRNRFTGLIPYLFKQNYQELYKRMLRVAKCLINKYGADVGQMLLSLLNFLKQNDKDNYQVFYNQFLEIKDKYEGRWTSKQDYKNLGLGYQYKVYDKSFMDMLD